MFALPDAWVWDFWLADDGARWHLFFLYAPRELGDPDARHRHASIGHAVSADLVNWQRVGDALTRGAPLTFDEVATWTGSVVAHPDGTWFMFYTGIADGRGAVQRVSYATSDDLLSWRKHSSESVVRADARWYEVASRNPRGEETFRDPWVFRDPDGDGWHMLITARSDHGPEDDRGVVGHAWSPDLRRWETMAPLSQPGQGFGHLEVLQVEVIDGTTLLIFSCLAADLSTTRRRAEQRPGIWYATARSALGPYDLRGARPLTDERRYSGRLVRARDGRWLLLAFRNEVQDGHFVGDIADPVPVRRDGDRLKIGSELSIETR